MTPSHLTNVRDKQSDQPDQQNQRLESQTTPPIHSSPQLLKSFDHEIRGFSSDDDDDVIEFESSPSLTHPTDLLELPFIETSKERSIETIRKHPIHQRVEEPDSSQNASVIGRPMSHSNLTGLLAERGSLASYESANTDDDKPNRTVLSNFQSHTDINYNSNMKSNLITNPSGVPLNRSRVPGDGWKSKQWEDNSEGSSVDSASPLSKSPPTMSGNSFRVQMTNQPGLLDMDNFEHPPLSPISSARELLDTTSLTNAQELMSGAEGAALLSRRAGTSHSRFGGVLKCVNLHSLCIDI